MEFDERLAGGFLSGFHWGGGGLYRGSGLCATALPAKKTMEIGEAFYGDVVTLGFDFAPDGGGPGDHFYVSSERFDYHVAVVFDVLERFDDAFPFQRIASWCAAVGAAGVEMAEIAASFANGIGLMLLLDIHVESVEVQLHGFAAHRFHELEALIHSIEEIGLEAIERFNADRFAFAFCVLGQLLQVFHDHVEVLFFYAVLVSAGEADDTIDRADEARAIEDDHLVDKGLAVLHRGLLLRGSAAEIASRSHASAGAAADEARLVQTGFDLVSVDVGGILDGDFHGIETPILEFFEEFDAVRGERRDEEERIDAEAHGYWRVKVMVFRRSGTALLRLGEEGVKSGVFEEARDKETLRFQLPATNVQCFEDWRRLECRGSGVFAEGFGNATTFDRIIFAGRSPDGDGDHYCLSANRVFGGGD